MFSRTMNHLTLLKSEFYTWKLDASLTKKFALALGFACITGLMAQVRIPLPFTPVPLTGQTVSIMIAAVILGRSWGGISVILYLALGMAGIPWFTGMKSGVSVILGPTGGYLIGFAMAAFVLGRITEQAETPHSFLKLFVSMFALNMILVHGIGLVQLSIWSRAIAGTTIPLGELLFAGSIPFIAGDMIKIAIAAGAGSLLAPKNNSVKE